MTTAIQIPTRPVIKYPDSDGKPMSDNTLQYKWIVTIKEGVDTQFRHDPNVFVAGDLLWYAVEGNNKIRTGPDVLVAFGRPKGNRGSYMQWVEGGIAPQVVFEVLSPGNRAGKMKRKFQFYQQYGVEEYYIYNPDNGDLVGWRRVGQTLEKISETAGFVSPRLHVRFEPGKGPDNLTIIGSDGKPFRTFQEIFEESEAAERRAAEQTQLALAERRRSAEAEQQRAEAEQQRAEAEHRAKAAEQRAEQYAAKLRELGIEPD